MRLTDSSNICILESGEMVLEEGRHPEDIVVGEEDYGSTDFLEPFDHLKTLVGHLRSEDLNMR